MDYAYGTSLVSAPGPFSCGFVAGSAMCSDGKVRRVRFGDGIPDTFFSIPARVHVGKRTVSGFVTVETEAGMTCETNDDRSVVKFVRYTYGKNADALPPGAWRVDR